MKRLSAILAAAALVLWLSLMNSRGNAPSGAAPQASSAADAPIGTAVPPASAAPTAASPPANHVPKPAPPNAAPAPAPAAPPTPVNIGPTPVPESELIPLPPQRDNRPHFTAAQARAGSPGKILGHAFAREKPDPKWSPGAEADIRKVLDKTEVAKRGLLAVECRSSVCKLQVQYSLHDRDKYDAAFGKLKERFGTNLGFEQVSQMDSHGQQLLRVYVMREGKTLRDFPP